MTVGKPPIMPRLTPKTAMWLWLIFGGIFGAFGLSTLLSAIGSAGLTSTVRFVAAGVGLAISAFYFRNAWKAYRDGRNPK
jgi:uncharacterized membrane-anchored protein YitT (DUF2179 family)